MKKTIILSIERMKYYICNGEFYRISVIPTRAYGHGHFIISWVRSFLLFKNNAQFIENIFNLGTKIPILIRHLTITY